MFQNNHTRLTQVVLPKQRTFLYKPIKNIKDVLIPNDASLSSAVKRRPRRANVNYRPL